MLFAVAIHVPAPLSHINFPAGKAFIKRAAFQFLGGLFVIDAHIFHIFAVKGHHALAGTAVDDFVHRHVAVCETVFVFEVAHT